MSSGDGEIIITASGGTGSYEYSIDGGISWSTSNAFTGLGEGSYTIAIRNEGCACEVIGNTVHLDGPEPPVIDYIWFVDPSGCGVDNGEIIVYASGDGTPLQYSIDGGDNWSLNNAFAGLAEGMYSVRVRYINGTCASEIAWVTLSAITNPKLQVLLQLMRHVLKEER